MITSRELDSEEPEPLNRRGKYSGLLGTTWGVARYVVQCQLKFHANLLSSVSLDL